MLILFHMIELKSKVILLPELLQASLATKVLWICLISCIYELSLVVIQDLLIAHAFRIYNNNDQRECIGSVKKGASFKVQMHRDCSLPSISFLWRWWLDDNRMLQHIESALCLTSSLPESAIGVEKSAVVLNTCNKGHASQVRYLLYKEVSSLSLLHKHKEVPTLSFTPQLTELPKPVYSRKQ